MGANTTNGRFDTSSRTGDSGTVVVGLDASVVAIGCEVTDVWVSWSGGVSDEVPDPAQEAVINVIATKMPKRLTLLSLPEAD